MIVAVSRKNCTTWRVWRVVRGYLFVTKRLTRPVKEIVTAMIIASDTASVKTVRLAKRMNVRGRLTKVLSAETPRRLKSGSNLVVHQDRIARISMGHASRSRLQFRVLTSLTDPARQIGTWFSMACYPMIGQRRLLTDCPSNPSLLPFKITSYYRVCFSHHFSGFLPGLTKVRDSLGSANVFLD